MATSQKQDPAASARQSSRSTDKLLIILECLAQSRMPMRLQDISEAVGFTQSTVLRYLRTLQNTNYVYQEEDSPRYALTWKLCQLTAGLDSFSSLGNIVDPFINRLCNDLHMGGCLVIPKDSHSMYLRYIEHPYAQTPRYIGRQVPLHAGSSGKLLMSQYTPVQLDAYIEKNGLTKMTCHTISTREALEQELKQIRSQGYSMDREECEEGFECISYPLYSYRNRICATFTIFGTTAEIEEHQICQNIHQQLSAAASQISRMLGWTAPESEQR